MTYQEEKRVTAAENLRSEKGPTMQPAVTFSHDLSVNKENKVDALSEFPCWRARLFGHHFLTTSSVIACPFRTAN